MSGTNGSPTAVVLYAALSRKKTKRHDEDRDDEESIESQIAKVRDRIAYFYKTNVVVLGTFHEVGHSGSKRSRGPELERAIRTAVDAVDTYAVVELWSVVSARFARGTGKRDEARAVGELFYDLRRKGVTMRTVEDDDFVTNEMLVGFASAQASKYAADLSESVRRSKQRQLARGEALGGPLATGYERGDDGTITLDEQYTPIVHELFAMAGEGIADAEIARRLNQAGRRTRAGRPFDRRAVQNIVTNHFYSGRIAYKRGTPEQQIVDADHPALIDRDTFDRIQTMRAQRDLGAGRHVTGRPASNHALAKLAICERCGERMFPVTSSYRRKDGSRARRYECHAYRFSTGVCDAPAIDAEVLDAAVIAGLDTLLVDFEVWRRQIEDGHRSERDRLADEVRRADADLVAQASKVEKVQAKWGQYIDGGDDHKADLVLPMVEREREILAGCERRLRAAQDALADVPADAPADAMLDFGNALQSAIRGRMEGANSMRTVNGALREMFDAFVVGEVDWDGHPLPHPDPMLIIRPVLAASVAHRISAEWSPALIDAEEAPPLRWLDPERNVQNSHEFREFPAGLSLPAIRVSVEETTRRVIPSRPDRAIQNIHIPTPKEA